MRNLLLVILFVFPFLLISQDNTIDRYHKQQQQQNVYEKSKKFKGPKEWNSSYPSELYEQSWEEEEDFYSDGNNPMHSILSDEQLGESRGEKYGSEYSNGAVKKPNPNMIPPDPIELPDIDMPDIDLPDVDLPDFDMPSIGTWEFWKVVLLILVIGVLLFILYLIIRQIKPGDAKVRIHVDDECNPTVITKSELELKLEKAIMGSNYRECVRIHFMFILKELINKQHINWRPEKTNYDYLLETRKSKGYDNFGECVRIYDLVWYGDYEITRRDYEQLKPTLENYYQSLNPEA